MQSSACTLASWNRSLQAVTGTLSDARTRFRIRRCARIPQTKPCSSALQLLKTTLGKLQLCLNGCPRRVSLNASRIVSPRRKLEEEKNWLQRDLQSPSRNSVPSSPKVNSGPPKTPPPPPPTTPPRSKATRDAAISPVSPLREQNGVSEEVCPKCLCFEACQPCLSVLTIDFPPQPVLQAYAKSQEQIVQLEKGMRTAQERHLELENLSVLLPARAITLELSSFPS